MDKARLIDRDAVEEAMKDVQSDYLYHHGKAPEFTPEVEAGIRWAMDRLKELLPEEIMIDLDMVDDALACVMAVIEDAADTRDVATRVLVRHKAQYRVDCTKPADLEIFPSYVEEALTTLLSA